MNRRGFFAGLMALPFAPRMLSKPTKLKWMDGVKPLRYWRCYYERDPHAQFLRERALADMIAQNEFWTKLTTISLRTKINALKRKAGLDTYQKL